MYTQTDSERERRMRMASHNLRNLYKQIGPYIRGGFEDNGNGRYSDFDMFMKVNLRNRDSHIYQRKDYVEQGRNVFGIYQITQGSLPEITCSYANQESYFDENTNKTYFWSNIQLGSLSIDNSTTVGQFAQAVVANNNNVYEYGDQITFIFGILTYNQRYITQVSTSKVILEENSSELLSQCDVLENISFVKGFQSYDGKLAIMMYMNEMYYVIADFCMSWIHSRKENGKLIVSTQHLASHSCQILPIPESVYIDVLQTYDYNVEEMSYIEPIPRPNPPEIENNNNRIYITAEDGCDIYYTYSNNDIGIEPDINDIGSASDGHTARYNSNLYAPSSSTTSYYHTFKAIAVKNGKKSETSSYTYTGTIQQEI